MKKLWNTEAELKKSVSYKKKHILCLKNICAILTFPFFYDNVTEFTSCKQQTLPSSIYILGLMEFNLGFWFATLQLLLFLFLKTREYPSLIATE